MYTAVIDPWNESTVMIFATRRDMIQGEPVIFSLASKLFHCATWRDDDLQQGVECALVLEDTIFCQKVQLELVHELT